MKIAFLNQPWEPVTGPSPRAGSVSIWTWEIARRLARKHEVIVYDGRLDFSSPRRAEKEGVQYRFLWVKPDRKLARLREQYPSVFRLLLGPEHAVNESLSRQPAAQPWFYGGYARLAAQDMAREKFDAIHVHQCAQFLPLLARRTAARLVLHMSCEWLSQFDRDLVEPSLQRAGVISGCSTYIRDLIAARFEDLAERCRTIPNGVDTERFSPRRKDSTGTRRRLLFVGRVSPEKGVHDLLEAFAIVVRRCPDVELHIAGEVKNLPRDWIVGLSQDPLVAGLGKYYETDYKSHLNRIIEKNGLTEKVSFRGPIPNSKLADSYHDADILINPSLSESFGMTVVEAMSCGIPVVATRTGGMTETVVHGKTGLLVPPADPPALADAITSLVEQDNMRQAMGAAGRQRVTGQYSWDRIADCWLEQCLAAPEKQQRRAVMAAGSCLTTAANSNRT